MIVGAAVCPGAPLLVPGLAPELAAGLTGLRNGCWAAVNSLADVDRILLITSGPGVRDPLPHTLGPVIYPPGTFVSSSILTGGWAPAHFEGRLGADLADPRTSGPETDGPATDRAETGDPGTGDPQTPAPAQVPGPAVVVGAALLAAGNVNVPTTAIELLDASSAPAHLPSWSANSADRVGVLVIADGSAGAGSGVVGGGDPDAGVFDADVFDGDVFNAVLAAALAAGDPIALRGLLPSAAAARQLEFTSGPALAALAQLTVDHRPQRAQLLFAGASPGAGYLVAAWSWD